jgi:hypothetical protein
MSLLSNAIVTFDQAERFLGIDTGTDRQDLEIMINGLSAEFERETRRKLKLQEVTAYQLSGTGCDTIRLPFRPISHVAEITILNRDGTTYRTITNDTSPEEISNDEFTVNPIHGTVRLYSGAFPCGVDNVLVTWDAGYASASGELETLRRLLLIQLKYDYRRWKDNNDGVMARQFQDGGITFSRDETTSALLPRILKALERFRQPLVG